MDSVTKDLLLLNMTQDIGSVRLRALLDVFKTPGAILSADIRSLASVKGIGRIITESIKNAAKKHDVDEEMRLINKHKVSVLTIFDKDYPENLKNIYDPPILLYVKGSLRKSDNIAIAIVGSRRCSHYGIKTASRLSQELCGYGFTIVSGLARGIDTAAHKAAVSVKARTIAVLGNGLSLVYPSENQKLADEITGNGAVISEFPMAMPPHKENFPQRNRIISGLSKAVVVVEAAQKSGALITTDFALEQGRDVFAIPGNAGSVTSGGTNNLIKQGAKLAETAEDIIEDLGIAQKDIIESREQKVQFADPCEENIYNLLSDEPKHIDEVAGEIKFEPKRIKAALLSLQMKKVVEQLPGSRFVRA